MPSDAAPSPLPDVVARWRGALDNLSPSSSPCRNLPPAKWMAIRENAILFCDTFGAEAHRLGWTAPELFAVHREHGTIRLHACGVMMISGEPARGVDAICVQFERTSGYRNGPGQEWGIPIWEFARGGGREAPVARVRL